MRPTLITLSVLFVSAVTAQSAAFNGTCFSCLLGADARAWNTTRTTSQCVAAPANNTNTAIVTQGLECSARELFSASSVAAAAVWNTAADVAGSVPLTLSVNASQGERILLFDSFVG